MSKNIKKILLDNHKVYKNNKEDLNCAEEAIKELKEWTKAGDIQLSRNSDADRRLSEVVTIGKAITTRFLEEGKINVIGEKIKYPAELATLLHSYRSPLFETFRVFYMKKNRIVDAEGVSNHLPGLCLIKFENGETSLNKHINDRMEALGAEEYYLVHNHPSGDPMPSSLDQLTTQTVAAMTKGFAGHIILNHSTFCLLDKDGEPSRLFIPGIDGKDPFQTAEIEHPLLNIRVKGCEEIAQIGRELIDKSKEKISYMVYCDSKGAIRMLQEVSNDLMLRTKEVKALIERDSLLCGSPNVFCLTMNSEVYQNLDVLFQNKYLYDGLFINPDYPYYESKFESNIDRESDVIYQGKKIEDIPYYYSNMKEKELKIPLEEQMASASKSRQIDVNIKNLEKEIER